ncbi:flagellar export chaperone FliS [Soehngenia saccharolytica]|nr:flagellar export chaperone FliS [Soehngenia saccharolytica]
MNQAQAYNAYKENEVYTASKTKLVVMLYDGAIKNLKLAEIAINEKNIEKTNECIKKSQDILIEFMNTLNFEQGGKIAEDLYKLYDYLYFRLVRANIDKDIDAIREVKRFLEELRDAWAQL